MACEPTYELDVDLPSASSQIAEELLCGQGRSQSGRPCSFYYLAAWAYTIIMAALSFSLLPSALIRLHDALTCLSKFNESVSIEAEYDLVSSEKMRK